jgi:hypothetical protein
MAERRLLVERLIAALRLDLALYIEISADRTTSGQAFLVVLLSGVSNGLGLVPYLGAAGISAGAGAAVLGWFVWTAVVFVIAAPFGRRLPGRSLLRALGFATAPGVFLIVGTVPALGRFARAAVVMWLVAATVVAVEAAYGMSRRRAVLVSVAAFVVYLLLGAVSAYLAAA